MRTPRAMPEDNIRADQSLVLNTAQGLVVVVGCGHAGIVNILSDASQKFPNQTVDAVVGSTFVLGEGIHTGPLAQ